MFSSTSYSTFGQPAINHGNSTSNSSKNNSQVLNPNEGLLIYETRLKKKQLKWRITDFRDYFDFIDEHQSMTIISDKFRFNEKTKYVFHMELTFLLKSISVSLHCSQDTKFRTLTCQLSFANQTTTLKTNKHKVDYATDIDGTSDNLATLKLSSNNVLLERKDLFPDNILVIECNLRLVDDTAKKQQIHNPISCQSMKENCKALLENSNDSDVIFDINGKELTAHKIILKARSPVFAAMFEHDMIENNTKKVSITDISESTFNLLLQFIYTDEIKMPLDVETGINLLYAATKYQLNGLQNLCEKELYKLVTISNAKEIRMVAEAHNLTNFMKSVNNFIKYHTIPI